MRDVRPPGSGKANTARRLVEILQLLDDLGRPATTTVICDRGGWPSSSARELLAMMVEYGLLYRDEKSRGFRPSPGTALLTAGAQPSLIRDGRLVRLAAALAEHTGLEVAVFGMVGL